MRYRDNDHFPEKNIYKETLTTTGTVTPDLNEYNVYRIDASAAAVTIANPVNARDGQYIRIEIVSAAATGADFGTGYHVNGAIIGDGNHDADALVIYEGVYDDDNSIWNLNKLASKAA